MSKFKGKGALKIGGFTSKKFTPVKEIFEENFTKRGEIGASCCVYHHGELVVDLWGGEADTKGRPWKENTKAMVFSTTKGLASLSLAFLHSEGLFDYDDPIAKYWPDFAAHGKDKITIRQFLGHQEGLCAVDFPITPSLLKTSNFDTFNKKLANQKLLWPSGTKKVYHAWTLGFYMDAICSFIDPKNRNTSRVFSEEIASKINTDCYIGRPYNLKDEDVADLVKMDVLPFLFRDKTDKNHIYIPKFFDFLKILNPYSLRHKVMMNPKFSLNINNFNKKEIQALELASCMGFCGARDLAKVYSEFSMQTPNLNFSKKTLNELEKMPKSKLAYTYDEMTGCEVPISLGFVKTYKHWKYGNNSRAYGNHGTGGSGGFADPENKIGYAYVMNKLGVYGLNDPREYALRSKIYEIIGDEIY